MIKCYQTCLLKSTARKQSRVISGVTEILPGATRDPPRNWLRPKFENFSFSSSGNPHLCLRSENAGGGDQVSIPDHPANSGKKLTRFHELNTPKKLPDVRSPLDSPKSNGNGHVLRRPSTHVMFSQSPWDCSNHFWRLQISFELMVSITAPPIGGIL
ncbi:MAG: hypothetical protein ACP5VS_00245 [Desulfomonilaceae bacterium]